MFSSNNKISVRQLQILLILDIFGTSVVTMPRILAGYTSQDGWVLIIPAVLLGIIYVALITSASSISPGESFFNLCAFVAGRPLAYLISLLLAAKMILVAAFEIRRFGEVVSQELLRATPFYIICLTMLAISAYAAAKGFETRARLAELLILVVLVPIALTFLIDAFDVDYSNLLPVGRLPGTNYLKGAYVASFAFSGLEMLMVAAPYVVNPGKIKKASMQVVIALGAMFLAVTIITVARFGPIEIKKQMWPVIEIMDAINIPGSFIERQEALIMSFWIISVFASVNAGLFFSSLLLKDVFKKGGHSSYMLFIAPVIFLVAYMPKDIFEVDRHLKLLNFSLGAAFLFVIPLALIIIAKIRKVGG
ncbi:MAG: spore germination protein [Clostridiales bacterium]|jgi:spore germination protein|nr:spore germination protein [Clostridiales bacterium]